MIFNCVYLCIWKICRDEKFTLAVDEVSEDLDNIVCLEMLGGVATEDEVIAGVDGVCDDVMSLECPRLVTKILSVVVNVGFDNIKASEDDVRSAGEKLGHPDHVTTGGVKKPK